ncbi:MAG TPA: lysophospholipid acyltransferase family protein [Pyrinomonadaceae bacterium]|nr:lysophospholipid acyltransferase family protein [Pyrinomonadaceae bacterium]
MHLLLRRVITAVIRFALRVFFSRAEVVGRERVPREGAVMFVLNHPNGLVDPCFLLCFAPRRVSFLAKSPLFRMPVIGLFVRALDSIPVYRKQDEGADASGRNRETFDRSARLLRRGGTIAICPEGASHSEPSLLPLKSGAARIALGAVSVRGADPQPLGLHVVPAGLYYTAKGTFRSGALLYFGEPIPVEPVGLDEDGEPPRELVRELSDRIAEALRSLTLNADRHEALAVVARAERIFSSGEEDEGQSLERELRRRRRFVEGYAFHRVHSPERLEALERRIRQYEEELRQSGIEDPRQLSTAAVSEYARPWQLVSRAALFALAAPAALAGAILHYPAYRLAGFLATKFSQSYEDVLSTFKIAAALLLFPLTWALASAALYYFGGWRWALAGLLVAPLAGYAALRTREEFDRFVAGARAVLFFVTERRFFRQLLEERRRIRREILDLADEADRALGQN